MLQVFINEDRLVLYPFSTCVQKVVIIAAQSSSCQYQSIQVNTRSVGFNWLARSGFMTCIICLLDTPFHQPWLLKDAAERKNKVFI